MVTVNIVVEGKTDEFVARHLLEYVGLATGEVKRISFLQLYSSEVI